LLFSTFKKNKNIKKINITVNSITIKKPENNSIWNNERDILKNKIKKKKYIKAKNTFVEKTNNINVYKNINWMLEFKLKKDTHGYQK
jgi:hypothetical protein